MLSRNFRLFLQRYGFYTWLDPVEKSLDHEVNNWLEQTNGNIVFELGAGEGRWEALVQRHNKKLRTIDLAIGDAEWDYSSLDIIGDVSQLPLADESCELLLSITVLEHVIDWKKAADEMGRVLKKDGSAYVFIPMLWEQHQLPHDYHRFPLPELKKEFESRFEINHCQAIGNLEDIWWRRTLALCFKKWYRPWWWPVLAGLGCVLLGMYPWIIWRASKCRYKNDDPYVLGWSLWLKKK